MLVAAGLENKIAGRDRRRLRGRVPRRRGARQHPAGPRLPAGDRAHPRDDRARRAARRRRPRLRQRPRQRLLRRRVVRRATARLSGNSLDDAAGRPPRRRRARQARLGRLRALAGGRRGPRCCSWPTPRWGEGFPGWHLECSAMAMRHLGPRFDIHTGGIDNVFPHHEDEIAQSAPIVGGPPARLWVHGEFLQVGGQKMAKSAGNIERVAERRRARASIRSRSATSCLTSRYRHKLEYTDASLAAAAAGLASLRARLRGARAAAGGRTVGGAGGAPGRRGRATGRSGRADGVAGHGGGATVALAIADRAARAGRAPVRGRAGPPRPVRRRHRRRPRPADGAGRRPRDAPRRRCRDDERRWLVLDADACSGSTSIGSGTADPAPSGCPGRCRGARRRAGGRARRRATTPGRTRSGDELAERGWDGRRRARRPIARPISRALTAVAAPGRGASRTGR